ncbi:OB-fold domain-containing protein [Streptomyces sp. NBC_00513]|uniref:Zn-ribbon domain-containing OB-fold protein n=1 Tax=unclassified Streptomyces TaxID=2593676 RepID=UPI00225487E3|nr:MULTISPECIES: OB-fold domain-containing protein [unclassified Streptomyces]MCX5074045.1 OB-fold domain-containing protein [Streptomyces sp. NBC_00424]MCX5154397.1 OB-fold domain-containing protein [Streptomyces sp. NBC_00291]WUD42746.1 OB-fold domain-containing protein [Streptomyces sp. NBC_00513]
MNTVRYDLPEVDDFTRPYWDAAAQGRLLLRRCADCGRAHHYPREFCPYCWAGEERVTWEQAGGRAVLYTWSVIHRNDLPPFGERVPYVAAVVDLEEGPRLMTELVPASGGGSSGGGSFGDGGVVSGAGSSGGGSSGAGLRVGMPLEVAFREAAEGVWVPVFGVA